MKFEYQFEDLNKYLTMNLEDKTYTAEELGDYLNFALSYMQKIYSENLCEVSE